MDESHEGSSSSSPPPPLLPYLTLSGGEIETKTLQHNQQSGSELATDDDDDNGDPNRFNAYLNRGSELWTHWSWLGGQGKMSLMRCNYCLVNKQLKNAPKCRRHLIKCPKTPEMVRKYFEKKEVEATRVSQLMRELRSKEIKFPRNRDPHNTATQSDQKLAVPTANDLKHLHQKQQNNQTSIMKNNGLTVMGSVSASEFPMNVPLSKIVNNGVDSKAVANIVNSFPPQQPHHRDHHHSKQSQSKLTMESRASSISNDSNLFNELSLFYQQIMSNLQTSNSASNLSESIDLSNKHPTNVKNGGHSNGNMSAANKRKHMSAAQLIVPSLNVPANKENNKSDLHTAFSKFSNGTTITPNGNSVGNSSNTVIINLDDVNSLEQNMLFNPQISGGGTLMLNGSGGGGCVRKKKRFSTAGLNHCNGGGNNGEHIRSRRNSIPDYNGLHNNSNGNGEAIFPPSSSALPSTSNVDLDASIVHDDLNDLLASALISAGVDFEFITNPYFQKFISQLSALPLSHQRIYQLPSVDELSTVNVCNLIRQFDYETSKSFSESDSIVLSFDWNKENTLNTLNSDANKNTQSNVIRAGKQLRALQPNDSGGDLDVNLLISTSNVYSQLFFKTISFSGKRQDIFKTESTEGTEDSKSALSENLKSLNNQIDSLINKIGSDRINAVILPYDDGKSSELIYSYLTACHSHIVPLSNSYQLFHHLLCDICKIPSIHKLLTQCINLFRELALNFADFQEENQIHWKRVFDSDKLKIYKHFLKECSSFTKSTYWLSLNLVLCWFLVAKSSITELLSKCPTNSEKLSSTETNNLLDTLNLDETEIEDFFKQISILFNFLTPFINAMHLIENESTVISDIIKIYFDVKLAINNNHFFDGIGVLCNKTERQSIDCILHNYLQEQNFSRFFFLAYYLDPRFRADKRIEENEELIAQVYDTLFAYANALGIVNNEDEDRENLAYNLDEFRQGTKLYGVQLLKCSKSPIKFWTHLRRFSASGKLAYCAHRLLSISIRSMLLAAPPHDKCTSTLHARIQAVNNKRDQDDSGGAADDHLDVDAKAAEKILPLKSYLMSAHEPIPSSLLDEDENQKTATNENSAIDFSAPASAKNITNIISNVITSLEHYSLIIAQPFTDDDLSAVN